MTVRILTLMLFVLFGWLQFHLWFGKNGMNEYFEVTAVVQSVSQANEKLQKRNLLMYAELADLKQGQEAVEERARNELGMVKTEETFFRIINE